MEDDNYFSDEEWNDAVKDPNKIIVLGKYDLYIDNVETIEKKKEEPDIERIIESMYENLKKYENTNAVELINKCSYSEFYNFISKFL